MNTPEIPNDERTQQAVADRLTRLGTMPVDVTRLAGALRARIPELVAGAQPQLGRWRIVGRAGALAASFLVLGAVVAALLVGTSGGPVMASAGHMARLHEELVSGATPAVQVDSMEAANRAISQQWPQSPGVPGMPAPATAPGMTAPGMPGDHVMACCMKSVKDKKVVCVLLRRDGVPVSLVVAHGKDMTAPQSPVTVRNGIQYHTESSGKLNMVMTQRAGRWVCLIGELPAARLMDLADQLRF